MLSDVALTSLFVFSQVALQPLQLLDQHRHLQGQKNHLDCFVARFGQFLLHFQSFARSVNMIISHKSTRSIKDVPFEGTNKAESWQQTELQWHQQFLRAGDLLEDPRHIHLQ